MTTALVARSDREIQNDVLSELRWDARVVQNEVGVTVKNGIVTLTGRIDNYLKRSAAEEAALRVRGVKAVADDLEVKLANVRDDSDIAAAAARAVEWDAFLPTEKIHVAVSKGWATLKGEVNWRYQRDDAERVIRRLEGVRGVTNNMTVKPNVQPSQIKDKIEKALVRSAEVDAHTISVEVDGGKVVLMGRVRSWAEKQEAERTAWSAPGVGTVDNRIEVSFA